MFDLDRYLERIGLAGRPGIVEVHRAHSTTIPFENLDPHRGVEVSLTAEDLFDKLVTRRRGGYCFEQNLLLAAALQALGWNVELFLARVRYGAPQVGPGHKVSFAHRWELPELGIPSKGKGAKLPAFLTRAFCEGCNTGWMAELAARSLVGSEGRPRGRCELDGVLVRPETIYRYEQFVTGRSLGWKLAWKFQPSLEVPTSTSIYTPEKSR